MENTDDQLTDNKLVKVLEFFLSLHEADEIYNMIYNDNVTVDEINNKLEDFKFTETL